MATRPPAMPSGGDPSTRVGRGAAGRFLRPSRRALGERPRPLVGSVLRRVSRFSAHTGRSLTVRRLLDAGTAAGTSGHVRDLPVGLAPELWSALNTGLDTTPAAPAPMWRRAGSSAARAALAPGRLPRATAGGLRTEAGEATGPAAGGTRLGRADIRPAASDASPGGGDDFDAIRRMLHGDKAGAQDAAAQQSSQTWTPRSGRGFSRQGTGGGDQGGDDLDMIRRFLHEGPPRPGSAGPASDGPAGVARPPSAPTAAAPHGASPHGAQVAGDAGVGSLPAVPPVPAVVRRWFPEQAAAPTPEPEGVMTNRPRRSEAPAISQRTAEGRSPTAPVTPTARRRPGADHSRPGAASGSFEAPDEPSPRRTSRPGGASAPGQTSSSGQPSAAGIQTWLPDQTSAGRRTMAPRAGGADGPATQGRGATAEVGRAARVEAGRSTATPWRPSTIAEGALPAESAAEASLAPPVRPLRRALAAPVPLRRLDGRGRLQRAAFGASATVAAPAASPLAPVLPLTPPASWSRTAERGSDQSGRSGAAPGSAADPAATAASAHDTEPRSPLRRRGGAAPVAPAPGRQQPGSAGEEARRAEPEQTRQTFLAELATATPDPVTPIPAALAPLADAVAGRRAVGFSHGRVSRRALAAAGKQAATVGSVVHLPVRPEAAPIEVVAHELVHAARPSPVPRFFADDHRSSEEILATTVGQRVRRAMGTRAFSRPAVADSASTAATSPPGSTALASGPAATSAPAAASALLAGTPMRRAGSAAPAAASPPSPAVVSRAAGPAPIRRRAGRGAFTFGTGGLAVNDGRGSAAVARRPVGGAALAEAASAAALASASSGASPPSAAPAGSAPATPVVGGSATPPPGFAATIHRSADATLLQEYTSGGQMTQQSNGNDSEPGADDELFERLVERLEERLRADLERRGRWFGAELR